MKLTITPTDVVTRLNGVPCRHWLGTTESGRPVDVFVHLVASADPGAMAELDRALREQSPPRELPLVQVLGAHTAPPQP